MLYVPKKARRAFKKDVIAMVVAGVMTGGLFPFLAFVASHRLHTSATVISLILCSPWVGNFLALVWANAMIGKSKMRFVTNSWIIARSIFLLMLFANTPFKFALIAMIGQFIGTISVPGYAAIMRTIYPDDHRGKLMGYTRVALAITTTILPFIVGPILKHHGDAYRIVFPIAALFGIAAAFIFRSIEVAGDDEASLNGVERQSLPQFLKDSLSVFKEDRNFAWFNLSMSVYGFGNFLMMPVYPKFQDEILKMNEANLGILFGVSHVALLLSYLYWGHFIDRKDPIRAAGRTVFINIFMPLTYFAAPYFFPHFAIPSYIWVLPAAAIAGITSAGCELSYFNCVMYFAPHHEEARYQGLQLCLQGLRGVIGPIIGGILYDIFRRGHYDAGYLFLISAAFITAGWLLQLHGMRKKYPMCA